MLFLETTRQSKRLVKTKGTDVVGHDSSIETVGGVSPNYKLRRVDGYKDTPPSIQEYLYSHIQRDLLFWWF